VPTVPAVPQPAATVLLLRDDPNPPPGRGPLQVFLQRRVAGMAFAGGMTVFPGGRVDPSDRPDPRWWSGPSPTRWAQLLGCTVELAGALVHAAVRETFEECGVLLAGPGPVPHHERQGLVTHRRTLGEVLAGAHLTLRSDLLAAWSRWITPEQSPKRFDTAFFVARVPANQQADAHTTEVVEASWWHPAVALEHWERGDMQLLAPTFTSLREIAAHPDAASVLAAAAQRVVAPITPRVRRAGDQVVVMLPDDPGFEAAAPHLTPGSP
jgi:8-oxo-dGTP pyrophosphatase MutT (NUDIX family)